MIDFLAEAAVLVGLLAYARNWREEPEPEEAPPPPEEKPPAPRRNGAQRPAAREAAAPEAPASPSVSSLIGGVTELAGKLWSKLEGWGVSDPEKNGSAEKSKPGGAAGWNTTPSGKTLWAGQSPFKAPSRPAPAAKPEPAGPGTPPATTAAPRGPAEPRPAMIRCPTCGTEVPWARAVSLRQGSETLYFCSSPCRSLYSKGQSHA